jgi:hypothetical protein
VVRSVVQGHTLTTRQLGVILELFHSDSRRVEAVKLAAPRVVDPENGFVLKSKARSSSSGRKIMELMSAQVGKE